MNPIWSAALRRNWPLVGAVGIFAVFTLVHQLFFVPTARRYQDAVKQAAELGLSLDLAQAPSVLPPRVFALVADNALPGAAALELGNSGVLTARLLEDLTRAVGRNGMEVMMTEPGAVTQESRSAQARAFLRVRGRYGQLVALLDDLAKGRELLAVDRFSLAATATGQVTLDLWVSRLVLKQDRTRP